MRGFAVTADILHLALVLVFLMAYGYAMGRGQYVQATAIGGACAAIALSWLAFAQK